MALTREIEQRLEAVGLNDFYSGNRARWDRLAREAYDFIGGSFPEGSTIRQDDVVKALHPLIEVDEVLREFLGVEKLTQKYWVNYFVFLILDRCWDVLTDGGDDAHDAE